MHFSQEFIATIRTLKMEIHCLSIHVWQNSEDGPSLKGHGTIKQNKFGNLYMEFVCTDTQYSHKPNGDITLIFPKDSLNLEETLFAEIVDISGRTWKTQGFRLELSAFGIQKNKIMYIPLSSIESEEIQDSDVEKTYLHLEFEQEIDIPYNKANTTTSSATKSESHGFNELSFNIGNTEIRIVNESEYRFVKAIGGSEPEAIEQCLKFHLGFSCGTLIQPYILFTNVGHINKCIIRSFNNQLSHKRSSNPIPSNVQIPPSRGNYSVELFEKILKLHKEYRHYFNCLSNHWERVWRAFNTTDDLAELVLAVAIEGILNDIYIPNFKMHRVDQNLVSAITDIKKNLDDLDIEQKHLERLKSSVSYWMNITAAKALEILINEEVLGAKDKKLWNKVRNGSAHPTSKKMNSVEDQQKRGEVLACLDIFHKLVLNVLTYAGPVTLFSTDMKKAIYLAYTPVLKEPEKSSLPVPV
ncbi:hypothetical protein [Moritella sp.]|uniref:hypothetical protein n=1 Tax=Moritella sp. TaxID=78556 RepID=UPI001D7F5E75|nr:hypothetical protein [Moritella sp.]MCJ8350884.1 hypothetical protein [Moritella sp.]NQZ40430.1 hypothetical protein [Moritella sp.]